MFFDFICLVFLNLLNILYIVIQLNILKGLGLIGLVLIVCWTIRLLTQYLTLDHFLIFCIVIICSILLGSTWTLNLNSNIIFLIDGNHLLERNTTLTSATNSDTNTYLPITDPKNLAIKELFHSISQEYLRIHGMDSAWHEFDLLTRYITLKMEPITYLKLIDRYLLTHLNNSSIEFLTLILNKKKEWIESQISLSLGSQYINSGILYDYFETQYDINWSFVKNELIKFSHDETQCNFLGITETYFLVYHKKDNIMNDSQIGVFFFSRFKKHCDLRIEKIVAPFLTPKYEYLNINWTDIRNYFYLHPVYSEKFIPIFLNFLVDHNASTINFVDSYLQLHMQNGCVPSCSYNFLEYFVNNNSDFLKNNLDNMLINSGVYPTIRTDINSYHTQVEHYNNYLHTNPNLDWSFEFLIVTVIFSFFLFIISLIGLLFYHLNIFIFLFFTELYLFSSIFLLIVSSLYFVLPQGQIYALILLGVAAAEAAVGIGLLLVVYRIKGHLSSKSS